MTAMNGNFETPVSKTLCFDVDGVLCDDRNPTVAYRDRVPYPWVARKLRQLREAGWKIVLQTARYMVRCYGDQAKAHEMGYEELRSWCEEHQIPYDAIYFGKAASAAYFDDKACRLLSNNGESAWEHILDRAGINSTKVV